MHGPMKVKSWKKSWHSWNHRRINS